MKKYNKPTVNVVSLKSSEDIARKTFKDIRGEFINGNLYDNKYAISTYTITNSVVKSGADASDS